MHNGVLSSIASACKGAAQRVLPPKFRDKLREVRRRVRATFAASRPHDHVFTEINRTNAWGSQESVSGAGSTLDNTQALRRELPSLVEKLNVKTILDLPCGDFNWMHHITLPIHRYIGADIVAPLIGDNQRKYGKPGYEFRVLDLTVDALPESELLICRDCLMHLSPELVEAAIRNILRSKIRYLLTTTHPHGKNHRIMTGEWFPINLQRRPYLFPPPLLALNDSHVDPNAEQRNLSLWEVADLRKALAPRFGL